MNCPTCKQQLSQISIEDIQLDVCKDGCGGIWFDRFELQKMDESHEFTDENLVELLSKNSPSSFTTEEKRNCPKCDGIVMMLNFFSFKKEVKVDHCPKCAGYWLDDGELFAIRNEYKTKKEREQAAIDHFTQMFDGELVELKKERSAKTEQVQTIANLFRLISPSYYFNRVKNLI